MSTLVSRASSGREREPALDFWRGFFLLMIYINHLPDNLFSRMTPRNWGFADSAEAFIFISGISAMLAFGPYFEAGGWKAGLLRVVRRAWQLFCAHILLVFSLVAMIAVASDLTASHQVMDQFNFSPFFIEPKVAVVKLLKLGYLPNLADILPLYIVLIFLFPVIWGLTRMSSLLALAVSFALWFAVNLTGFSIPNYPEGAWWFFNPFAWQLLFVAGMVAYKEQDRVRDIVRRRSVFWVSVLIVTGSALLIAPWANIEAFAATRFLPTTWIPMDDKMNLAWIRIVHFFALTVVGTQLVRGSPGLWNNKVVRAISVCGRHGLAVFCSGTILSLFVHILLSMHNPGWTGSTVLVIAGIMILVFLAVGLEAGKNLLIEAEKKRRLGLLSVEKV